MKIRKIAVLLLVTAAMMSSSMVFGEVKLQRNGFTISLPEGWVEIPRAEIDSYENKVAALVPDAQSQHFDCGFQLNKAGKWFEYPYILIQIKNVGRVPESQLAKLEGFPVDKAVGEQKKKFSSVISDIQAGKMIYDGKHKMIWMRMELDVRGVGPVSGISGLVLTERGFIQVNGYCLKSDLSTFEPVFRSIATSVIPDPGLAYKPTHAGGLHETATGIDWSKVAAGAGIGAIIGGIAALIAAIAKKKKQR